MWWRRSSSANQKIMDRAREPRMARLREEGHGKTSGYSRTSRPAWDAESGGKDMIRVTRLNGEVLYLNVLQIESMESIPETKIKMMNGYYYLVKDTADSVMEQLKKFYHSCIVFEDANR